MLPVLILSYTLFFLECASDVADPGFELTCTSVEPTNRTCYKAPGLPSWLRGTYLIGGPAQFELGKYRFNALFDGFGMLHRFELMRQEVCYTSIWLDTRYRRDSFKNNCPVGLLFETSEPPQPLACEADDAFPIGGDNNWVNGIQVGDEVLMLSDTSLMLRLNINTLEQPGRKAWSNDYKGRPDWMKLGHRSFSSGSAHPVRRPGTNTWVAIVSEGTIIPFEESTVAFYTYEGNVSKEQPRKLVGRSAPLTKSPFVHSFGVTPNYIVLPITLMTGRNVSCTGGGVFCGMNAHWQGIHLIDFSGNVSVFNTTPFAHVHVVNAFENATGVTLDVGAYDLNPFSRTGAMDVSMMKNKTERDRNNVRAVIRRVHLHLRGSQAGQATFTDFAKIHGSHSDFYKTNPNHIGRPYCFYYATQWFHDGMNYASMAILKHNVCSDTITYWSRPNTYVGEPFMIPGSSGEEDDGVVVFVTIDGERRQSSFVTLDAKTMIEINNTSVHLSRHIPFTGHGDFFPASREELSTLIV